MAFFLNLPQEQTVGSALGAGLGQGLQQGVQAGLTSSLDQYFTQKKSAAESARKESELQKFFSSEEGKMLTPEERAVYSLSAKIPGMEGLGKEILETRRKEKENKEFQDIINKHKQMLSPDGAPGIPSGYTKDELTILSSSPNKQTSTWAENTLQNQRDQDKLNFEKIKDERQARQFAHTATKDYAKQIEQISDRAHEIKGAVTDLKGALNRGASGASARNIAYSVLAKKKSPFANLFIKPDMQTILTSSKTLLGGGLKEIVGSKPTEREFFWIENIIPNILKDMNSNVRSAEYFEKMADYGIKKSDIYDEIVKENGGYRPINIDQLVRDRMRKDTQNLIEEGYEMSKSSSSKISEFEFEEMPKATPQNAGKIIEDDKGNKYRSNGKSWRKI